MWEKVDIRNSEDSIFGDWGIEDEEQIRTALQYRWIEHFDYIISTQQDGLIDKEELAESFIMLMNRLGLIA